MDAPETAICPAPRGADDASVGAASDTLAWGARDADEGERLAEAMELSGVGLFQLDLGSPARCVVDARAAAMLGLAPGDVPEDGRALLEWLRAHTHPADLTSICELLEKRPHEIRKARARVCRSDGEYVWLSVSGRASYDEDGRLREMRATVTDDSERHALQEQLEHAQRLESLGRLTGGVAHEFNNLLTAMLAYADFARSEVGPSSPAYEDLAEVLRAGERCTKVARQLLAFSRKGRAETQLVDLNEVVLDADQLVRRTLGEDVEVVTIPARDPHLVRADPFLLQQVLLNLAVNSRDAMPEGGTLTIEVGTRLDGSAPCGVVRVSDTGTGMSDQTAGQAFEPFFTTKAAERGTGLGLSICSSIMEQADGSIHLEQTSSAGTVMLLSLPLHEGVPVTNDNGSTSASQGSGMILVVENEPVLLTATRRMLERCGYETLGATTGVSALEVLRREGARVDLVLSDVVMPMMGGAQLAAEVQRRWPHVQTVFMSGYADRAMTADGHFDANIPMVEKPFTEHKLASRLSQLMPPPRTSGAT